MKIRLALSLLLLLVLPAGASAEIVFTQDAELFQDVDRSGDATCGDRVSLGMDLFSRAPDETDLTNVTITVDIPFQLTVNTAALGPNQDNDCSFVGQPAGNPQVVVSCPFVCSTAGCAADGVSLSIVATIENPNSRGSFTYQARVTSDQGDLFAADLSAGSLQPPQATTFEYELCPFTPPPDPADLVVTKRDQLVGDLDGDGLVDAGDTVRYLVEVTGGGEENVIGARFESDVPVGAELVVGSVSTPLTVVSGNGAGDTRVVVLLGGLSPGFTRSLSFDVVVEDPLPAGIDELVCQGEASAENVPARLSDDPDTAAGPDPTVTPLDFDPDLALTKRAGRAQAGAGETIVFDLTVASAGWIGAAGVVVEETVPPHTRFVAALSSAGWSCADGAPAGTSCALSLGELPVGESVDRGFAVRVVDALPAGATSTTNLASVADDGSRGPDLTPGDNADSATVALVGEPAVSVAKSGPASVAPGELLTYTLTYVNDGTREATGLVVTETVPAHTFFDAAASTPGWSCADGAGAGTPCTLARASLPADGTPRSVAFAVRVADGVPAGVEVIANRVELTHDDPPGDPPDDEVETPLDAEPSLTVSKSGPATVTPGSLVVYDLEVVNGGDQDAAAVMLTETVPPLAVFVAASSTAGWSCADGAPAGSVCTFDLGTVAAGGAVEVGFAIRLAPTVPAGVEALVNAVLLSGPGVPSEEDEVTSAVVAAPDLAVDKGDGDAVVVPGGLVLYTFSTVNRGDQDAAGVIVSDRLPEEASFEPSASTPGWSCGLETPVVCSFALGDLAAGATAPELVLALRLDPAVPLDVEEIVDVVTVAGSTGEEADPVDNTDSETTPVERVGGPQPEMAVVVATLADAIVDDFDGDGALDAGEVLSYVAVVSNRGPAAAENVILSLPPDVHSELTGSPTTTHGAVQALGGGDLVSAALGDLAVDETATVTFEVVLREPVPAALGELVVQGAASLDNGPVAVTDDPDTPAPLDPTRTPVDAGGAVAAAEVPAVSGLGLTLLAALLAVCGHRLLRRRRDGAAEVSS